MIDEADLDAKPSNALAAVGVGIALVLTLAAVRRAGVGDVRAPPAGRRRGGRLIVLLLVAGIPWILSNAGFYAGDVPGLRSIFMSKQILPEPGHPNLHAVHLGNHEGIDGILLAATALALRRVLPQMRPTRLRAASSAPTSRWSSPYGLLVAAERRLERAAREARVDRRRHAERAEPGPTPSTALLIALAVVLYLTVFRMRPAPVE